MRDPVRPTREIVTPEGIPLEFVLGDVGERASAFLLDMLVMLGILLGVVLLAVLASGASMGSSWVMPFVILVAFFVRNFYFVWYELRWQGSTPGKRVMGLRVIDRHGGPLRTDAVVARNLMRDVEVFVPLSLLMAPGETMGVDGIEALLVVVWALILALLPLFNKDRLRVGDLVGGTMVVRVPKSVLLPDLAVAREPLWVFTDAQLDVYGIYELQTLEDVLRKDDDEAIHIVSERIMKKIGWTTPVPQRRPFLEAFYAALRGRLERRMLLGKKRMDKHDR